MTYACTSKKLFQNFLEQLFLLLESARSPQLAKAGFTASMSDDLHILLNQQFGMRARVLVDVIGHAAHLRRPCLLPLRSATPAIKLVRRVEAVLGSGRLVADGQSDRTVT